MYGMYMYARQVNGSLPVVEENYFREKCFREQLQMCSIRIFLKKNTYKI